MKRLGFMAGHIRLPDGFERMGAAEIEALWVAGNEAVAGHPPCPGAAGEPDRL
jgi:hypothetical protein